MSAIKAAPTPEGAEELVTALRENEFDIAALADFQNLDEGETDRCLNELWRIVEADRSPKGARSWRLAVALVAMVHVAQEEYAESGHQEYWTFLFDRIARARFDEERWRDGARLNTSTTQRLLGEWARAALDRFQYVYPNHGQKNVGPIVFHAGVPRKSLPGLMALLDRAFDSYGDSVVHLPNDIRRRLVREFTPSLHTNLKRLLDSDFNGAAQIWACLGRVVSDWRRTGDCEVAIRMLPAAIDPDAVRKELNGSARRAAITNERRVLPRFRFDPDSGMVSLFLPEGARNLWRITDGFGAAVKLRWIDGPRNCVAEFLAPPPGVVRVERRGNSDGAFHLVREFSTTPREWDGILFRTRGWELEDAAAIDANGLEPGRWIVLFDGCPTQWSVATAERRTLGWSLFKGFEHWTAWEVDVPRRDALVTRLECRVDENRYGIELARRPRCQVELIGELVASGLTPSGSTMTSERVDVFNAPPAIRMEGELAVDVFVLRQRDDRSVEVESRTRIGAQPWTPKLDGPGVYEVREARGWGRQLARFAFLPGLEVSELAYDDDKYNVEMSLFAPVETGGVKNVADNGMWAGEGTYRIERSTVEPTLEFDWGWAQSNQPELRLVWDIEGLRWRLLGIGGTAERWTRETLIVDRKALVDQEARLEVQVPSGSRLTVGGVTHPPRSEKGLGARSHLESLRALGEEACVQQDDGPRFSAVIVTETPVVEGLTAGIDKGFLSIAWEGEFVPAGTRVLVWATRDPFARHLEFPLDATAIQQEVIKIAPGALPDGDELSIALGRASGGFTRRLALARSRSERDCVASIRIHRERGEVREVSQRFPNGWLDMVHVLGLWVRQGSNAGDHNVSELMKGLKDADWVDLEQWLAGKKAVLEAERPETVVRWLVAVEGATERYRLSCFGRDIRSMYPVAGPDREGAAIVQLLRLGYAIGHRPVSDWLEVPVDHVPMEGRYPFGLIRDLWMVGVDYSTSTSPSLPMRVRAAERLWSAFRAMGVAIEAVLPLNRGSVDVRLRGVSHTHALAMRPKPDKSLLDFVELLGLRPFSIEGEAACDDVHWRPPAPVSVYSFTERHQVRPSKVKQLPPFSWTWDIRKGPYWVVEHPLALTKECCRVGQEPATVTSWEPQALADRLGVVPLLGRWAQLDSPENSRLHMTPLLDEYARKLATHPHSGALHRELLAPARVETRSLLGVSVQVPSKVTIDDELRAAWTLAWTERLMASDTAPAWLSGLREGSESRCIFLSELADAIERRPRLMQRCLALAELMIWTLQRGGLGIAARFRPPLSRLGPNGG